MLQQTGLLPQRAISTMPLDQSNSTSGTSELEVPAMNETSPPEDEKRGVNSITLVQTCMGDYRDQFVEEFTKAIPQSQLTIQVGPEYYGGTTFLSEYIRALPNTRLARSIMLGNMLGYQLLDYKNIFSADVVIAELNPRILTSWIILIIRKLSNKPTILWGHAWGRKSSHGFSEFIRGLQRDLADALVFYTRTQKKEYLSRPRKHSHEKVYVASNALYLRQEMYAPDKYGHSFIYVGRLVDDKKPIFMVEAFARCADSLPQECCLHIAGSGPLLEPIKALIQKHGLESRVYLHGHVSCIDQLRELYHDCIAAVSPGYVGLSAIQSLTFGIPMIVSRDEPHAPEVEALEDGFSAMFFDTDDIDDLATTYLNAYSKRIVWNEKSPRIADYCRKNYSVESMVEGFVAAING